MNLEVTASRGRPLATDGAAKTELVVCSIVTVTAVLKVLLFGSPLAITGDIVFLLALCLLRTNAALVMLLLCSAIAIPGIPGIDKIAGGPFHIEVVAFVLAFRVWLASGLSARLRLPPTMVAASAVYGLILSISIVRGGKLTDHLVTTRYFLLMLITTYAVRNWIIRKEISRDSIEELIFRSFRAGLIVYLFIFVLQFLAPGNYDHIFLSSGGEREGTRVAYQIQGYIPIVSLALLFLTTIRSSKKSVPTFYRSISRNRWVILAFFGMLATGARMVLLQWIILAAVFIFFKSKRAIAGLFFAALLGVVMLNLPMFESVAERFSSISDSDAFVNNLGIRLLPAILAVDDMSGIDYLLGKGLDFKFFVPWFETRSDDFDAYSTFIDQLWATVFVQGGILGCALALIPFLVGVRFYVRNRDLLRSTPAIRFLILTYLMGIHGFSNLAYSKNVYVVIGILAGAALTFHRHRPLPVSV